VNADNPTMVGLLIIAHAPLASALRQLALHAFPDAGDRVQALDVQPDVSPDRTLAQARAQLAQLGWPECLILTDAMGATPCNLARGLIGPAHEGERRLVSGVNVPMLWRAICYAHEPLDVLVAKALEGASAGVMEIPANDPA
jgi:PTS system mannose-specific IIA component